MNQHGSSWFSATLATGTDGTFSCASCHSTIDLGGSSLDHHPRVCPACGIVCLYWSGEQTNFQIVPELAPAPMRAAIQWAQTNLDELDFVELVVALEELVAKTPQQAS